MASTSTVEKRLHPRVNHQADVFFKPGWKTNQQGYLRDLSEKGTFLVARERMHAGNEIILYMPVEFKGKESLCMLHGRVVRIEKKEGVEAYGYGICFGDIALGTISLLRKFIEGKLEILSSADPKKS